MPKTRKIPRGLIEPEEFLVLSAKINYQLTSSEPDFKALTALILGRAPIPERTPIIEAIECIYAGYGKRPRKLGPPLLIHPLRTTAIIARSMEEPTMMDILGALLHDKEEDLTPKQLNEVEWKSFNQKFLIMKAKIDPQNQWFLGERMGFMRRDPWVSYNDYIRAIIGHAKDGMPDLLHIKLADRLDNTFDTHLQISGSSHLNFYRNIFDILFVPGYRVEIDDYHFEPKEKEIVLLLSQLHKNIIFLSFLRREKLDKIDDTTSKLFDGVAIAGIREAQALLLELFDSVIQDDKSQWSIVSETLAYTHKGGVRMITREDRGDILDGVFEKYFGIVSDEERKERLMILAQDKNKLARVVLAFIVTFSSLLNEPDFYVEGIEFTDHDRPANKEGEKDQD